MLSVIIVNWNTKKLLERCLFSIYRNTKDLDFEVIVIDNGSTDGSADMVETEFPKVRLVKNAHNTGFTRANNQGIKMSRGNQVLLLNSDTELIENSFKKMYDRLSSDSKLGILGPKLLHSNKTIQHSVRTFPTLSSQLIILTKLHNVFPKSGPVGKYYMSDFNYDQERQVDQVMGAALLIKKEVITKIGLLDQNFWAWFEEVDLCKRTKDAGYKILFYPDTSIIHHKGESFQNLARRQRTFNKSLTYYFSKHHPGIKSATLKSLSPLSIGLAYISEKFIKTFGLNKNKNL